jgi:serine/threonine protein phosphatase PrpC
MTARLRVTLGQASLVGAHDTNQDFHGALLPEGHLLASKGIALAIADGISSSAVSQLASQTAVRSFLDDYYATSEAWSVRRAAERVLGAVNSWLHAQTQASDARFEKDRGHVHLQRADPQGARAAPVHVGDSRIYRLHAQALEQLTDDHRVRLSSTESYLGRALGTGPHVEIDYRSWEAEPGEIYLLATDGAYTHLDAPCTTPWPATRATSTPPPRGSPSRPGPAAAATTRPCSSCASTPCPSPAPSPAAAPGRPRPAAAAGPAGGVRGLHHRARAAAERPQPRLATDTATGRPVVLKTPSVERREDSAYLDGFVLEEWVARRVDSPHVIKAWPDDRRRAHLYVAMEYIDGQTLAQWMADNPEPSLASVRAIVEQLAQGLQALHRREMLHQDLRPENVMIDGQGTVKLIDLATVHVAGLDEMHGYAAADLVPGALQYAAPEYLLGQGGSPQSDLFSLAVVTYRMLGGQLPYGLDLARARARPMCGGCATSPCATAAPTCRPGSTRCSARPCRPTRPGARR